jgi:hypothetical protein
MTTPEPSRRHAAIGETTVCGLPYLDVPAEARPLATWVLSPRAAAREGTWKAVECDACLARLDPGPPASNGGALRAESAPEPEVRRHVFDAEASAVARDAAIEQVEDAASAAWKAEAFVAVARVCETREEFTTDAVWAMLDERGVAIPREPRAMGAIMRRAVTAGLCLPTDRTSKSVRIECHRRPLQIWASNRYREG